MTKIHTREEYIQYVIPYRMKAVAVFNLALRHVMSWDKPGKLEIYFNDKLAIRGLSTAFTNPAIEAGIMHCRALLEFIGLKVNSKDPDKLSERQGSRDDDFVIEDFSGPQGQLQRVPPGVAISSYTGPPAEAEKALAAVIRAANKGVAHTTAGHLVDGDNFNHFEIASRGVPKLLVSHFYTPLGLPPPDYELASTPRDA
jgi:hypothetical protein